MFLRTCKCVSYSIYAQEVYLEGGRPNGACDEKQEPTEKSTGFRAALKSREKRRSALRLSMRIRSAGEVCVTSWQKPGTTSLPSWNQVSRHLKFSLNLSRK